MIIKVGKKCVDSTIDDEDYEKVSCYKWQLSISGYAICNKNNKTVLMHRIIINAKQNDFVDHIDGNKLNNSKSNLRICTIEQNRWNTTKMKNNRIGFKGVVFHKQTNKYHARIQVNKKVISLGIYDTPNMAHEAYKKKAELLHGEFYKCTEK